MSDKQQMNALRYPASSFYFNFTVHVLIMIMQRGITVLIEPLIDHNYFLSHQDQGLCVMSMGHVTVIHFLQLLIS